MGSISNFNKLFWHGDKIRAWQKGQNPFPVTMQIDPTGACNLNCPMCAGGERTGFLKKEVILKLLDEFKEGDVRSIVYAGGGEPTMHKDLREIITITKYKGFDISLITNGSMIHDDLGIAIISNCTWVRVSLDSFDNESYEKVHGASGQIFNDVIQNIGKLADKKRELDSNCTIGVSYLVDDTTMMGMKEATSLVKDLGASYIQFRPFEGFGSKGFIPFNFLKFTDMQKSCNNLASSSFKVYCNPTKFEKISNLDLERNYSSCYGMLFSGAITATGDVPYCCSLRGNKKYSFGNIHEHSFYDIWNSDKKRKIIENFNAKTDCWPLCRWDDVNPQLEELTMNMEHENFI